MGMPGLLCLWRSALISASMASRMASLQARWQISVRSAPEKPSVMPDRYSRSTSYRKERTGGAKGKRVVWFFV